MAVAVVELTFLELPVMVLRRVAVAVVEFTFLEFPVVEFTFLERRRVAVPVLELTLLELRRLGIAVVEFSLVEFSLVEFSLVERLRVGVSVLELTFVEFAVLEHDGLSSQTAGKPRRRAVSSQASPDSTSVKRFVLFTDVVGVLAVGLLMALSASGLLPLPEYDIDTQDRILGGRGAHLHLPIGLCEGATRP